jgi:hypothetical protein
MIKSDRTYINNDDHAYYQQTTPMTTAAHAESFARPADAPGQRVRFGTADLHADGRFDPGMAVNTWREAGVSRAPAPTGARGNHRARSTIEGTL